MLSPEEVTTLIGHAIGGVCPFGINDGVDVYLDESLKRFDTVFPAWGSSNSAIFFKRYYSRNQLKQQLIAAIYHFSLFLTHVHPNIHSHLFQSL